MAHDPSDRRAEEGEAAPAPGPLTRLLAELVAAPDAEQGGAWEAWLRPGAVVGRFELVQEIGRGGFGLVWEARDRELGRAVAFKAVRATGSPGLREERLLREAELAARLSHPNIVTVLDVGRSAWGPFLVLELLRGQTLAERLVAGPLSPREAVRIGLEVAGALAHAHALGVVHRDLKPGNVFLQRDGPAKVLDFGLAHAFGRPKEEGGTPDYMAPEQRRGAPEDERTDVFALGIILYRCLTGALPFPRGGGAARRFRAPPAVEVPGAPGLGPLLARLLARDPVQRPRNGAEVLRALGELSPELDRHPGADRPGAATTRARGPAPHSPPASARARDLNRRGRHYLRQTRGSSLRFAAEMFARACELDPANALAHAGTAEATALLRLYYPAGGGDLDLADRESAHALALAPELAEAHAARGLTRFLQGHPDEAERSFERAEALDPGLAEAAYYHGRICFQAGRFAEAARLFLCANEAREDHQSAFFAAQATEALGRHGEARALYLGALAVAERYMDLTPDDPRAATGRGVCLCRIGRVEEGLQWAEQALAIDPRDAGVRYNVACLCAQAGRLDRALEHLEAAVRAGFGSRAWFDRDPDLAPLRGDPRFEALLATAVP